MVEAAREEGQEYAGKANEVVKAYLDQNPQLKTKVQKEKIDIANPEELRRFLAANVRYSVGKFRDSLKNPEKFEQFTDEESGRVNTPLQRRLLDITISGSPVTLAIDRYVNSRTPHKGQMYTVRLIKGNLENEKEIVSNPDTEVCTFGIRVYDNEFRLSHRYLPPKYRGQKLGTIALGAVEEFVREYAKQEPSREPVMDVYAAQLDVLSFYDGQGYESVPNFPPEGTTESRVGKIYSLDEVMGFVDDLNNGTVDKDNPKFKIGPFLYTFPGDFPEEQYFTEKPLEPGLIGRWNRLLKRDKKSYGDVNINRSALVHFQKRIEPNDEILPVIPEEISEETRTKLVQNLLEPTFLPDRKPGEKIKQRVRTALQNAYKGGLEEFDEREIRELGEENVGYSIKKSYVANRGRIAEFLNKGHVIGARDEYGNVVAIAAYKQNGQTPDGRPIFEITKVSRLKEAGGKGYGKDAMADAVKYVRTLYPDSPIETASKTPGVIAYFKDQLGWEVAPWGDTSNPLSSMLSGKEPGDEDPQWQKEWRKMRDSGYVNLYFDPKKKED